MAHLNTHVLDTSSGKPAVGLRAVLSRAENSAVLADATTNADGRLDKPLLDGGAFALENYEIAIPVGDYFRARVAALDGPAFFDVVPARFAVAAGRDYHLSLLISSYGNSTYRGI